MDIRVLFTQVTLRIMPTSSKHYLRIGAAHAFTILSMQQTLSNDF